MNSETIFARDPDLAALRQRYQDGSTWQARDEDACFGLFWRDKDHPQLPVLPPLQLEMEPD